MSKKIYILLATYNGEKYLKEQLDSLFEQTNQHWTLWIHDDNSKDNTVSIIKEYQSKYSNKIKFLDDNISTGGAKENFTYLLNNIDEDYDYVMFCDQDDIWLENKIEITLDKMLEIEKENLDKPALVHTDLYIYDGTKKNENIKFMKKQNLNPSKNSINNIFLQNIVVGCTVIINKELYNLSKMIPEKAIMHDWWIAMVSSTFGAIYYLDEATLYYRQHENNTVGVKQKDWSFYKNKLLNKQSLEMNFNQLQEFYNIYKDVLSDYTKINIQNILKLPKLNFF